MKNFRIEIMLFFHNHLKPQLEAKIDLDMHISFVFLNISIFTLRRKNMADSVNTLLVSGYMQSLIMISNKVLRIMVPPRIGIVSITSIRQSLGSIGSIEELQRRENSNVFSFISHTLKLLSLFSWVGHQKSMKRQMVEVFQIMKEVFQKQNQVSKYPCVYFNHKAKRQIPNQFFLKPLIPSYFYSSLYIEIQSILAMIQIITNKETGAQYKLHSKAGEGAYAQVYKGENVATKKIVAVKKMKSMKASDTAMAQKQVQLMKCLDHKNIVRWIDDFRDKGIWYIVLEYCGKGDLQKYKEKVGKIPEYNCKALVRGVLQALVEIHSEKKIVVEINKKKTEVNKKKIAHRDLKLANILVDDKFQLKLADFGFSKDFQEGWLKSFCGSPVTMAPEVLKRERYNEKCDVWSLGVITYYLLYNVYPFMPGKGDVGGLIGLTNAVTTKIHKFDPSVQVSEAGKDFMNLCLRKPIDKRPYSHELLNHPWWASLSKDMKWTDIRSQTFMTSLGHNPAKQAEIKLLNVFYGVCDQHTNKLMDAFLLSEEEIKKALPLFQRYYSDKSKYIDYYRHLIVKKLNQLKNRQIMITIEKKKFTFTLAQIKQFQVKFAETLKLIGDLKTAEDVNMAEELAIFLSEETEKLLSLFNQDEVDDKINFFKQLAKFITTDFDFTLINIQWGNNQELSELFTHIFDMILKLTSQNVVDMINKKQGTEGDLESIWTIQHHISLPTNEKQTLESQLGSLVLKILEIPSNFNIDKTMQTELLQFKNYEFNEVDFLNFS